MKVRTKMFAALVALLLPFTTHAIPITLTGAGSANGNWEITLIEDSFNDIAPTLTSQVWFGNSSLALAFAGALGPVNGVNNLNLQFGPLFLHSFNGIDNIGYATWASGPFGGPGTTLATTTTPGSSAIYGINFVYASATRVPLPATFTLFGLGLLALGWSRRKCS